MPHYNDLYYEETGKAAGKPLLLLHGLAAFRHTWRHLKDSELPDYRIFRIDLRGFGDAKKPAGQKYSLDDQAALVLGLIGHLGLSDVTIVGHSMGGGVALATAPRLAPGTLRRLVLIGSVAFALIWRACFPYSGRSCRSPAKASPRPG
jgi:pimeloyl-ACP methyl ester carboxylesterase